MISLAFVRGSVLRRVVIKGKTISFITQELGGTPLTINLNKLGEKEDEIIAKMGEEGLELFKEIALLTTEEDMAKDVKKDFQRDGWRLFKKQ